MKVLKDNKILRGMIAEMMFEMHYDSPHVNQWFGDSGGKTQWSEVLAMFSFLRKHGLRLHYWP